MEKAKAKSLWLSLSSLTQLTAVWIIIECVNKKQPH
jgi:hypothetical protein